MQHIRKRLIKVLLLVVVLIGCSINGYLQKVEAAAQYIDMPVNLALGNLKVNGKASLYKLNTGRIYLYLEHNSPMFTGSITQKTDAQIVVSFKNSSDNIIGTKNVIVKQKEIGWSDFNQDYKFPYYGTFPKTSLFIEIGNAPVGTTKLDLMASSQHDTDSVNTGIIQGNVNVNNLTNLQSKSFPYSVKDYAHYIWTSGKATFSSNFIVFDDTINRRLFAYSADNVGNVPRGKDYENRDSQLYMSFSYRGLVDSWYAEKYDGVNEAIYEVGKINYPVLNDSQVVLKHASTPPSGSSSSYREIANESRINLVEGQLNSLPVINLTTADNQTLSEVNTYNKLTITGTTKDADPGDVVTVKYTIDGLAAHTGKTVATLTADGTDQSFGPYEITIDATISEGARTLRVWSEDNKGGKSTEKVNSFSVDKTPPTAPVIAENPPGNASSKTITITFSGDSLTKEYQIGSGSWTPYAGPFTITQNETITARATDVAGNQSTQSLEITSIQPPVPIVAVSDVINTGFKVTDTGTYTDPVEYQFDLYDGGNATLIATYPSSSTWQDESEYTFTELNPNVKYKAVVRVRFK